MRHAVLLLLLTVVARAQSLHEVVPGSAAAALGVKRFDVIVAVDGQTIRGPGDAPARLGPKADPATPLELLIVRGGEQITLKR